MAPLVSLFVVVALFSSGSCLETEEYHLIPMEELDLTYIFIRDRLNFGYSRIEFVCKLFGDGAFGKLVMEYLI
jgi:hypothetical protein